MAQQLTFHLQHLVEFTQARSNVDNPDRTTADCTLVDLRREYGPRLIKAAIHRIKQRSGRSTWTVRYTIKISRMETL